MSHLLKVTLKGGLLLGGGAFGALDDATLRRPDGAPYIPASALKGAIREQMIRIGGEAASGELLGASGNDVGASVAFEDMGKATKVYLADADLISEDLAESFRQGLGYASKIQVSLDRRTRRARDRHLFHREIIAPFVEGVSFQAQVEASTLSEEQLKLLRASVLAVFALGGSRSSGLGGVELELIESEQQPHLGDERETRLDKSDRLELVLEAVDPVSLSGERTVGNFQATLDVIPASTLRGAIITAALRHRKEKRDLRKDLEFQRDYLDPSTCLRFGDASPVKKHQERAPSVAPLTLRTCKVEGQAHGHGDTLVQSFVQLQLAEHRIFVAPDEICGFSDCGQRRVPLQGRVGACEPERRVLTRLALDRRSARGQDGALFSLELLERGTRWVARLDRVQAQHRDLLRDAAREGLRVGNSRGQGYGRVRLVEARAAPPDHLASRIARFDHAIREALERATSWAGLRPDALGAESHYITATLFSDMCWREKSSGLEKAVSGEDTFTEALGLQGAQVVYGQVKTGQRGGFDTLKGRPKPYRPILRAGSVLLLRFTDPISDPLLSQLQRLEADGLGICSEEGHGWIRFSDDLHLPGWRSPKQPSGSTP